MAHLPHAPIRFMAILFLTLAAAVPLVAFASQDSAPQASPIGENPGLTSDDGALHALASSNITAYAYYQTTGSGHEFYPAPGTLCITLRDTTSGTDAMTGRCFGTGPYGANLLYVTGVSTDPSHAYRMDITTNTTGFPVCISNPESPSFYYSVYVNGGPCNSEPTIAPTQAQATSTSTPPETPTVTATLEDGVTPTVTATATETSTPSPTATPAPTNKWVQAWVYKGDSQNSFTLDGSICFQFNDTTTEPHQLVFEDCLVGDELAHYESIQWNHTYDLSISSNTSGHEACIDRSDASPTSFYYYIRIDGGKCNQNYGYRVVGVYAYDPYDEWFAPGNDTYCFTITDDQTGATIYGETCSESWEGGSDTGWWGFIEINLTHTYSVTTTKNTTGCTIIYELDEDSLASWKAVFTCGPTIYITGITNSCSADGRSVNFNVTVDNPVAGYQIDVYGAYGFIHLAGETIIPMVDGQTTYTIPVTLNNGALGRGVLWAVDILDADGNPTGESDYGPDTHCVVSDPTATFISLSATAAFKATGTAAVNATATSASAGATATQIIVDATATEANSATATARAAATGTASANATATATATLAGATATEASANATGTAGAIPTETATLTPTATATTTATVTPTATATPTTTATATTTATITPTATTTATTTATATFNSTETVIATATSTDSATATSPDSVTATVMATGTVIAQPLVIKPVTITLDIGETWLGKLSRYISGGIPPYTFALETPPQQGTVHIDPTGLAVYIANTGAHGSDRFTFTVQDAAGVNAAAMITGEVTIVFPDSGSTPIPETPAPDDPTATIPPKTPAPDNDTEGSTATLPGSIATATATERVITALPSTGASHTGSLWNPATYVPLLLGILLLVASALLALPQRRMRRHRNR